MTIEKANCDNCGFKQEHIPRGFRGSRIYALYACPKCQKIISRALYEGKLEKCPDCGTKLIALDEERFDDDYHTCPKCGKRKLKFSIEAFT